MSKNTSNRGLGPRQPATCSVGETAMLLGVSTRTIQREIEKGSIGSLKIGARRLVVRTELDRLLGGNEWRQGGVA